MKNLFWHAFYKKKEKLTSYSPFIMVSVTVTVVFGLLAENSNKLAEI